ncbi:MAG: ribosome silencing factor [Deltaproteobacteria bacterium]|nr:ribosome silencing factor [Deltaproteobacteria bacterium]
MYQDERVTRLCSSAALKKHAKNVMVLDLRVYNTIADYFIICSGWSKRQVQAIVDGVLEELKKSGMDCNHVEGYEHGTWVLIDLGDTVVHVFQSEVRLAYDLEGLWQEAGRFLMKEAGEAEALGAAP